MLIDFSTARPSITDLKNAGVTSVGRYLGWDGVSGYPDTGKNLTRAEADLYLRSGISIFLVFEYLASAPALGAEQGSKDGTLAKEQLAQVGAPVTACVYFAVDYDTPDYAPGLPNTPENAMAKLGPIGEYFAAIKRLNAGYRIGVYGGYWVVKRLFDAGLVTMAWQTVAWSGGNVDHRASIMQTTGKSLVSGADPDVHQERGDDWGQWPAPGTPPLPQAPNPQPGWAVCTKCYCLYFGPNKEQSLCPRGGTHDGPSHSYALPWIELQNIGPEGARPVGVDL